MTFQIGAECVVFIFHLFRSSGYFIWSDHFMFFLPVELIVNRIHYLIIILICQTLSGIWYSIKPKRDSRYKVAFCDLI